MSTTLAQARDAILTAIKTAIDALDSQPDVVFWDNVDPTDNPAAPNQTWLIVSVDPVGGDQTSIGSGADGSGRFRFTGIVGVRVFTPTGGGTAASDTICQALIDALQGKRADNVWFDNVRPVGQGRFKQWHEQRVVADYRYDDDR